MNGRPRPAAPRRSATISTAPAPAASQRIADVLVICRDAVRFHAWAYGRADCSPRDATVVHIDMGSNGPRWQVPRDVGLGLGQA